jgi:hypothetical protein
MFRPSALCLPIAAAAVLTFAPTSSFSGTVDDRSLEKNAPQAGAERSPAAIVEPDGPAEDGAAPASRDPQARPSAPLEDDSPRTDGERAGTPIVEPDDAESDGSASRDRPERRAPPRAALSEEAIADALRHGRSERGKSQGLVLRDTGRAVMNVLSSLADEPTEGSGFWIEVYTPMSWLAQLSSDAAREYHDLTPRELVPEDLSAVLRVVVHPDMPDRVSRRGMRMSASVDHVIIRPRGDRGAPALHPLSKREFDETSVGRHGRRATFWGVEAIFDLAAVNEARGASRDGELDVLVIGSGDREKTFSIKKKHFKDLPGLDRF